MIFRRDLWGELNRVQDEFTRLLNLGPTPSGQPVNVRADEHAFYLEADLPDLDMANLDVTVKDGNQLTIKGERKPPANPDAVWVRQERAYGPFTRTLTLPVLVDTDKVEAKYEDGVLKLKLPKHEAAKPRKIIVQS